jgi:Cys-rich protein (TIGR01571 family)
MKFTTNLDIYIQEDQFKMNYWRHGLFDCFGSTSDCLIGYCCPWIHAYIANQAAGEDQVMGFLQCFFYPLLVPILRNKVRETKGIDGSFIEDVITGWCCPCCSTIQVKREFD